MKDEQFAAVIIDPIYKVITGDENNASDMGAFCNQFDKVCTELGCAVIYCHHHSKGAQGGKRSMDRASGSGVFARDPDALLDLIELEVSEDLRKREINNAVCAACSSALRNAGKLEEVSLDDLCSETRSMEACKSLLCDKQYWALQEAAEAARKAAKAHTAWRIEGTLREFPKFAPVNLWFTYPIHREDEAGALADVDPEGNAPIWKQGAEARKKKAEKQRDSKQSQYNMAIESFRFSHNDEYPTVKELYEEIKLNAEAMGKTPPAEKTVRNSLKLLGYIVNRNTMKICPEPEKDW